MSLFGNTGGSGGSSNFSQLTDFDRTITPVDGNLLSYNSATSKWRSISVNVYTLELSRWGVSNSVTSTSDSTLATNNSNGINNALSWASSKGYAEVILPNGTYLISETIPIAPQSYMTLNLGGSTLRIRDNNLTIYQVICFKNNQVFSRVTNGIIKGDRDNHDYYYFDSNGSNGLSWAKWSNNTPVTVGTKIMPTNVSADNYTVYWKCTTAGTTGASEPTWNTTANATTNDNGVVWTAYSRATHEFGYGVAVGFNTVATSNTRYISVDNIEAYNLTGDGINLSGTFGQITWSDSSVSPAFEQGNIYWGQTTISAWVNNTSYTVNTIIKSNGNAYQCTVKGAGNSTSQPSGTSGTAVSYGDGYSWVYIPLGGTYVDTSKIRTTPTIQMSNSLITTNGYFGLYGNGFGNVGAGIYGTYFDVVFYNSDNSFNSCVSNVQFFDEVTVPTGASYAKVVLHQGNIPPSGTNTINLCVKAFPKYTYIEKCNLHNNRRLGIAHTGAKNTYIRGNDIHHISGTAPQGSIDIEDGYKLNQYVYIEGNSIHDTVSGFTVVNGRHITVKGNKITDIFTVWGNVDEVLVEDNFFYNNSNLDLEGDVTFINNRLLNSAVIVDSRQSPFTTWTTGSKAVGAIVTPTTPNGFYYYCTVAGTASATEPTWSTTIGNTITDGTVTWTVYQSERDILIENCAFIDCNITFQRLAPHKVLVNGCKFINTQNKAQNTNYVSTFTFKYQPQTIANCTIDGDDLNYPFYVPTASTLRGGWVFNNLKMTNITKLNTLVAGYYTGCDFPSGSNFLTLGQSGMTESDYTLSNCTFNATFTNINANLMAFNNARSVRIYNNNIQLIDGNAIIVQNVTGDVIIRGNRIAYQNPTASKDVIQVQTSFVGTLLEVEGNSIQTTKTPIGFNNQGTSTNIILKNNVLKGATLNSNGTEIKFSNTVNGVPDPYNSGTTASRPTNGNYLNRQYFDTSLGKSIWYNGTAWVDATGTTV